MMALSPDPGTPFGVQFVASFQLPPLGLFQVKTFSSATSMRTVAGELEAMPSVTV